MMETRILLVEDEAAQRSALERYLSKQDYRVDAVATAEEASALLQKFDFAIMLTDLRLPGMDGLELVRFTREMDAEIGILLMTAYASVESAVDALRVGAHDYLLKPLILDEVGRKVRSLIEQRRLLQENIRLRHVLAQGQQAKQLVSHSQTMRKVMDWARKAAASNSTVLLAGETGTGKEVVARTIHDLGEHRDQPFLGINLAAIPESMVESELFGHERGAFTGAVGKRDGVLRAAGQGTVFLDEIGELPLVVQAKLLRALEAKEVRPVGSDKNVSIQARILAATNRDLKDMVAQGTFREDLYYRLNIILIEIPPLRERPEDIPALCQALLKRHATRSDVPPPSLTPAAMRTLCAYAWPGNVRELSNVLERAIFLEEDCRIDLEHLPGDIREAGASDLTLQGAVKRFERSHVAMVLRLCHGNRELAAERLGISPATLYRRLEKLDLKGFEVLEAQADAKDSVSEV